MINTTARPQLRRGTRTTGCTDERRWLLVRWVVGRENRKISRAWSRLVAQEGLVNALSPRLDLDFFDYVLANGTTPNLPHWAWPGVPYASSTSGDLYFSGALDVDFYHRIGSGDGPGARQAPGSPDTPIR